MYDSTNEVLRILKKTIAELTSKQYLILSEIALLSCFSGLFIEIIRNHSVEQTAARHTVQQILEFTAKEFSSGISTKEVAAYCNQNPIYLERVFKKTTGESITEHIINLRLDNACKLIAGTTIPLTDIAVQSGFNSRQNFYEAFKKRLNTTPKLYRQSVAKELESNYLQTPFIKKYK
jgi:AraC-like DNA-binding protein